MSAPIPPLARWRLVLGAPAEAACCGAEEARGLDGSGLDGRGLDKTGRAMDAALDWLYGGDPDLAPRNIRRGGQGASCLTVPDWIATIQRLFPKETVERLERDALERFAIAELLTDPAVLARIEPNETLLKAVLRARTLLAPEVLAIARRLVAQVVAELVARLARHYQLALGGLPDRRRHAPLPPGGGLDVKRTLIANLRHYDPGQRRVVPQRLRFFARRRHTLPPWQIILLVDQSGSMLDSMIHAAVSAACLWHLPGVRTHLVTFDTAVVDLSDQLADPLALLMNIQLGGGTDIANALDYAAGLIDQPARAIIVLITDFFEGGSVPRLRARVTALVGQRTQVLGLAALDAEAAPAYDRAVAEQLVAAGAEIAAMTPDALAQWLAAKIR